MELDYLYEFVVLARLCNFTLAADELFISQSSLSKHIKTLEKEFGVELFDRTSRNISLSEAGELILPYAENLSQYRTNLLNAVAAFKGHENNSINIVTIPVMVHYDITGILADFQMKHADIQLNVTEHEPNEIHRLLEVGEQNFAFIRKMEEGDSYYDYIPICEDQLVAILPEKHKLAGEQQIMLNQLRNDSFMFLDQVTALYDISYNLCLEAGFTPNVIYSGRRPINIIDLVAKGMGISLLMKQHADYYQKEGVRCVEIQPTKKSSICLAKMKSRKMSSAGRLFWNAIKKRGLSNI